MKMSEHSDLIAEMSVLEKMNTQERLKMARKRRIQQLKKWSQREKEFNNCKRKKSDLNANRLKNGNAGVGNGKRNDYKVHFVPSVMLLEAAARSDIDEVRRLLMLSVSPDSTNEDGLTALHQCCIDDSEEMMKLLIEFGANVNAKDSEQWTPLHAAATCGHLHLVKYLISKDADLLAVNADGNMPYDICEDEVTLDYIESEMAKKGITQEMIDETRAATETAMLSDLKTLATSGEDLEYRDNQGATPLHIAAANGYTTVVEFLLDNHVSTEVVDNDLWLPIHAAACWGHVDVLELLVQAGSDLNAKTKNGETPFDICEDPELKERIIQLKSEIETKRLTHTNRLKRSHSQNTRSQSVRRTSIREKSQISRREAREEARLRQEQSQEQADDDDESKLLLDGRDFKNDSIKLNGATDADHLSPQPAADLILFSNDINKQQPQQQQQLPTLQQQQQQQQQSGRTSKDAVVICNNGYSDKDNSGNQINIIGSMAELANQTIKSSPAHSSLHGSESVKVEIHVTVNTSPQYSSGTLAELKRQRADLRHRNSLTDESAKCSNSSLNSSSISNNNNNNNSVNALTTGHSATNVNANNSGNNNKTLNSTNSNNLHHLTATYTYETPPSPSIHLKKFRGDPSEVVGDCKDRSCCQLM